MQRVPAANSTPSAQVTRHHSNVSQGTGAACADQILRSRLILSLFGRPAFSFGKRSNNQEGPELAVRLPDEEHRMTHQPGQATFTAILPEAIEWMPFPAFPPSVRLAVVVGQPAQPGPYTIRVKVPSGVKLMPHKHPEDRIYTVISGVFYIGLGDQFDGDKVQAYPPGSVIVLPGDTFHFHWAKSGEYITQVTAIGPLGLEYFNENDDPRRTEH
jgi:quercetin dioxygenase-like cupin family protein